jgi:hypothetical protein
MENTTATPLTQADEEHLRLLAIFHTVAGSLYLLAGFFPIIHLGLGFMMAFHPQVMTDGHGEAPPAFIGYLIMGIAAFFMIVAWTFGVLTIQSGRCMRQKRGRMFSLVIAGLNCCLFPIGTALGVFTFIVLGRPSGRYAYESSVSG